MALTEVQAVVDGSNMWRRASGAWLLGANVAVAVLLALLAGLVLRHSRQVVEDQARNVAEGIAAAAQLHVQGEIGRVDSMIRATASELERLLAGSRQADDKTIGEVLSSRFELIEGIEGVRLTDVSGKVRWGTGLPPGEPLDVSDREYFKEASRLATPRTLSVGPLVSRVSGNWIVAFMRPLRVEGRFAGLLYVSMGAGHFRDLFKRYALEPRDALTLRRDGRQLVARFAPGSGAQGQVGDTLVSAQLLQTTATSPRSGTFVSTVLMDGESRTTSYRALDEWPFVVYAGIGNDRFFVPWRQQAIIVISLCTLVSLLVGMSTWLVHRANRRGDTALRALADQGSRLQALLRTAGDGIHITDRQGYLVEMSDSFAEMLSSTRAQLMGRHISSWDVNQDKAAVTAWLAKLKPGDRQRVDVQHRRDDGQVIDVELQLSAVEIGGELLAFSSARDISMERRLLREQAAMLNSELVGMVKIENRFITWRNAAVEHILGYEPGGLLGQPARLVYFDEATYEQVGVEGYAALRDNGHYRSQIRMRHKSGESLWIDFSAVPLTDTEVFAMIVDITAMKLAHENLVHAAFHDALTQLPNRMLLQDRIAQAIAVASRDRKNVAICYLDLDGFKAVNDSHGHHAGDRLLQAVADRLRSNLRPSDAAVRLGGDEFVLVLASVDSEDWEPVLARVLQAIGEPVVLSPGLAVTVTATAGVTVFRPDDSTTIDELIGLADGAMLRGKRNGKGGVTSA